MSNDQEPGVDHLKVGDEVVIVTPVHRQESRLTPARITKQNRVWWEFEEIEQVRSFRKTWRMRKVTQAEGDYRGQHYGARFRTAEQLQWEDRHHAAERYLKEIRIEVWQSPVFANDPLTLANLVRRHLGLEDL